MKSRETPTWSLTFWLGLALALLGPLHYGSALTMMGQLSSPWHVPVMMLCGAMVMGFAWFRSRRLWRLLLTVLVIATAVVVLLFLVQVGRLPSYGGQGTGHVLSPFAVTQAGGGVFTERDLLLPAAKDGPPPMTALVFFRGRW